MKLPFWMYPKHWGLQGRAKEIALVQYNYTGIDEAVRIADIMGLTEYDREITKNDIHYEYKVIDDVTHNRNKNDLDLKYKKITKKEHAFIDNEIDFESNKIDEFERDLKVLDIKLKYKEITKKEHEIASLNAHKTHHKLTEEEYESRMVDTIDDETERTIEALRVNLKYGHITQMDYDKEIHNVHKKPWFNLDMKYVQEDNGITVEFDYNQYFIQYLRDTGHPGESDDDIIDNFIRDRGRIIATDDYDGEENFMNQTSETTSDVGEMPDGFREYK